MEENELLKAMKEEYEKKLEEQKEQYEQKLKEQEEKLKQDKIDTVRAIISGRDVSLIESGRKEEKKKEEKSYFQKELDKTRKNLRLDKEEK